MKQSETLESAIAKLKATHEAIGENLKAIRESIRENHLVLLPTKLKYAANQYHEHEGILIGDNYYLIVYMGEPRGNDDANIEIGTISRADAKDDNSEYEIISKIDKEIYDQLMTEAYKYYMEYWHEDDLWDEMDSEEWDEHDVEADKNLW